MSRIKYKGRDLELLSRPELIALIEYLFGRIEELKKPSLFDEIFGGGHV